MPTPTSRPGRVWCGEGAVLLPYPTPVAPTPHPSPTPSLPNWPPDEQPHSPTHGRKKPGSPPCQWGMTRARMPRLRGCDTDRPHRPHLPPSSRHQCHVSLILLRTSHIYARIVPMLESVHACHVLRVFSAQERPGAAFRGTSSPDNMRQHVTVQRTRGPSTAFMFLISFDQHQTGPGNRARQRYACAHQQTRFRELSRTLLIA
jgi:hypothetical protein